MTENLLLKALNQPEHDNYKEVRHLIDELVKLEVNSNEFNYKKNELFAEAYNLYDDLTVMQMLIHVNNLVNYGIFSEIGMHLNKK